MGHARTDRSIDHGQQQSAATHSRSSRLVQLLWSVLRCSAAHSSLSVSLSEYLPEFLPPDDGPPKPATWGSERGHQIYLIYQGIIHQTRMAASPLGRKRDVELVQTLYQEDWWLRGARNALG